MIQAILSGIAVFLPWVVQYKVGTREREREQCGDIERTNEFYGAGSWAFKRSMVSQHSSVDQPEFGQHSDKWNDPAERHWTIRHIDMRRLHLQEIVRDERIANFEKVNTHVVVADIDMKHQHGERLSVLMILTNKKNQNYELATETGGITQQTMTDR